MKKQTYLIGFLVIMAMVMFTSCKKEFLTRTPLGALSEDVLATPSGLNGLLIGAYAALDGIDLGASQPWSGSVTNWIWGSVAGGDAHKGSDATDQAPINPIATGAITPSNPMAADKWVVTYGGIDSVNAVLK